MRWYSHLNRYHWFVLTVAALGWLFDAMDQQLFNIARVPAISDLLTASPGSAVDKGEVEFYSGVATSIFLMGWATGGLIFGQLGDRIGRARTMMITILLYSICTGLSAFSHSVWDFSFFRFLTGLGVGGEFAVGVALVAEAMPTPARPHALGLLQALSAVGNIGAALISIGFGHLEQAGALSDFQWGGLSLTAWRCMFLVGAIPALLALVIRRRLHEPDSWKQAAKSTQHPMGSYKELFGDRRWRRNALLGMFLALTGVIGLWGIGFFSIDLQRSVFRKTFEAAERAAGTVELDQEALRMFVSDPRLATNTEVALPVNNFINTDHVLQDAVPLGSAIAACREAGVPISQSSVLDWLDNNGQTPEQREWRSTYLAGEVTDSEFDSLIEEIDARSTTINGRLTRWTAFASLLMNAGGFIGMLCVSHVSERIGRRATFASSYVAAGLSTAYVFWSLNAPSDVFWMMPLMGACLLSLFGGYAIYLPELFPTRLRSTGTSFCYNVGRFVAAAGPFTLGWLTSSVFTDYAEPMRPAGIVMCSVFLVGLLILPFVPETRGKPLPE